MAPIWWHPIRTEGGSGLRAVVMERLEGPGAARLREVPEPLGAHPRAEGRRVLVEVHAAGLSPIDLLQSRGRYQYGTPVPYVTGSEVAGVVAEADEGSGFVPGDRVAGIVFWGGLAERALVAPDYTIRLPEAVPFDVGAALYLNYSTAWYAFERARVRPGDMVLIHGAAGGVGTALIDLAPVFGVRTIAVVSSDAKARAAESLGADHVVRAEGPWLEEVRALTDGRGVEVVLDPVGGDRFTDSLRVLRIGGTLVVIGFIGGSIPEVRVNRLLLRNLTVTGISMDTMDAEYPGTLRRVRDAVQALLVEGLVHPVVAERYPLSHGPEALARLDGREVIGKVVVQVR
jgi:NADPH:quinone reductase